VKRYHYDSHDQLVRHLDDFVAAYNFGRRLKASRRLDGRSRPLCTLSRQKPALPGRYGEVAEKNEPARPALGKPGASGRAPDRDWRNDGPSAP
jgi:hypothetical protein